MAKVSSHHRLSILYDIYVYCCISRNHSTVVELARHPCTGKIQSERAKYTIDALLLLSRHKLRRPTDVCRRSGISIVSRPMGWWRCHSGTPRRLVNVCVLFAAIWNATPQYIECQCGCRDVFAFASFWQQTQKLALWKWIRSAVKAVAVFMVRWRGWVVYQCCTLHSVQMTLGKTCITSKLRRRFRNAV